MSPQLNQRGGLPLQASELQSPADLLPLPCKIWVLEVANGRLSQYHTICIVVALFI